MTMLNEWKELSLGARVSVRTAANPDHDLLWFNVRNDVNPAFYMDRQGLSDLIEYLEGVREDLYANDVEEGRKCVS